jgi:hypothetical protein
MALPAAFLEHLRLEGYHPRSDKHSNSLAICIARDLSEICPTLRKRSLAGEVVYDLNFDLHVRTATWNVDLVLGRAVEPSPTTNQVISRGRPARTEIAIEIKSVMTEHRKAIKNRKRDLEAHHEHVHHYDAETIAGGVFVVNQSLTFQSPLRKGELTVHAKDRNGAIRLVEHCLSEMRNVSERSDTAGYGLEAKCFLVVDMDNVNLASTSYIERSPAPLTGDPLNYDSFLQRICSIYERRFPDRA